MKSTRCFSSVLCTALLAVLATGCASPQPGAAKIPPASSAINVDVKIVRFPSGDALAVAGDGDDALLKLLRRGRGEVLHAFHLSAPSGVEAHAEDVTLLPYPALFKPVRQSVGETNAIPEVNAPGADARQIGADVTVLATLEEGGLISVCVAANVVRVDSWQTNRISVVSATNSVDLVAELPVFRKQSLDTCVDLADGASAVAGGPLSGGAGGEAIYVFLTARLAKGLSEAP